VSTTFRKCRAFNIYQVYQYSTIYRRYFVLKFEHFYEYLIQCSLKSGGTKYYFEQGKVPGNAPYWKAWKCIWFSILANFCSPSVFCSPVLTKIAPSLYTHTHTHTHKHILEKHHLIPLFCSEKKLSLRQKKNIPVFTLTFLKKIW